MEVPAASFRLAVILITTMLGCAPRSTTNSETDMSTVSLEDYQRAERFLAPNTSDLVSNSIIAQYWQSDDQLVYRRTIGPGSEYILVNPVEQSRKILLETNQLAAQLAQFDETAESLGGAVDLNLSRISLRESLNEIEFNFQNRRYLFNSLSNELQQLESVPPNEYLSPDGNRAAFIEDHNLWLRDTRSNELTQLTFDGVENYGYATNNAGWLRDNGPVLSWSPDSSKIATFRHDGRQVGEMFLYSTKVGHPELDAWRYPLPGDDHIFMIERIVICLLYTSPSPRDLSTSRMPSSA